MVVSKQRVKRGRRAMGWRTINWLKHSRRNDVQCNAASTNSALLAQELAANKALARELNEMLERDRELANEEDMLRVKYNALLLKQNSTSFASASQIENKAADTSQIATGHLESACASSGSIELDHETVKDLRSHLIQIKTLTAKCLAILDAKQ
ncbi:uncharacterized protein LOC142334809 isoform X2 [Convolutriloba macropyga]|uniref:uncharacterized protein LOC142334809 isoform X2 n=1 Tax=Convolutriloba macropyga TaxID=536237 RepID=UPI003F51B38C